jgi:hypothetical protein
MNQKGIIYYSHGLVEDKIKYLVQSSIISSNLPITSVSLSPINFGHNIVLEEEPGVITMFRQIYMALLHSQTKYVFYCEHDVLYHPSHFDFTPPEDDVYYFNKNNWRWDYPNDKLIRYTELQSLSGMCVNRLLALAHYKKRLDRINKKGYEEGRDPHWARKMGYEPGRPTRKGGLEDCKIGEWRSEFPIIDIRHENTITKRKCQLSAFHYPPTGWEEITLNDVEGWDLKKLFDL